MSGEKKEEHFPDNLHVDENQIIADILVEGASNSGENPSKLIDEVKIASNEASARNTPAASQQHDDAPLKPVLQLIPSTDTVIKTLNDFFMTTEIEKTAELTGYIARAIVHKVGDSIPTFVRLCGNIAFGWNNANIAVTNSLLNETIKQMKKENKLLVTQGELEKKLYKRLLKIARSKRNTEHLVEIYEEELNRIQEEERRTSTSTSRGRSRSRSRSRARNTGTDTSTGTGTGRPRSRTIGGKSRRTKTRKNKH